MHGILQGIALYKFLDTCVRACVCVCVCVCVCGGSQYKTYFLLWVVVKKVEKQWSFRSYC